MSKPVYSFGIIFKNEIRCLERCLKSLQPLRDAVSCEIVMADTGSTDGSREIAERYADILFDFPWIDDFAAARNAVMDRCSGVWYFSIDADEWLDKDVSELIAFAKTKNIPRDFAGVTLHNYQSAGLEKDQNYQEFTAIRMARLSTGVRYQGCIHETWPAPEGGLIPIVPLKHTMLYHDGYIYASKEEEKVKYDRNMPLLKKKLAENPDDIQTLLECIDSSKHFDESSSEYARKAIMLVEQKAYRWDRVGSVAYRSAVSVAQRYNLPELEEWIEKGLKQFPESIFMQIDMAYYAFAHYFDEKNYTEAIRWGERYRQGLENYRTKQFDSNELSRGVVEFESPFWERKVSVLMPQCYLETSEPEKALAGIREVKGAELEDLRQVELCVNMLMRIHRTTWLNTAETVSAFWEQISQPFPDEDMSKKRTQEFLRTAANAFTRKYQNEEAEEEEFLRNSFDVFSILEGKCSLGTAAAIMKENDSDVLGEKLLAVDEWTELPIVVLVHAMEHGMEFPLPQRPMQVEDMDALVSRLAGDKEALISLLLHADREQLKENIQRLLWVRGLAVGAVRVFGWESSDAGVEQGMRIARIFAETEREFIPCCYAQDALREDRVCMLPMLHRFGWYCAQAFDALDAGDAAGYVRLLRSGLAACQNMKDMVEFLTEHTPELQAPTPSAEMIVLAEQIRTVLAGFAPDDPAVAMLKQSEAYQKVAYLIEGLEPPIMGGQLQ